MLTVSWPEPSHWKVEDFLTGFTHHTILQSVTFCQEEMGSLG
jgi:hypothetical protein